jgi:hypothetical protein
MVNGGNLRMKQPPPPAHTSVLLTPVQDYRLPSGVLPSSSLLDCLGRVLRVKALRGRFASLDTKATAQGTAAIEEDGQGQGTAINAGRTALRRAISVLLTPVTKGLSRTP